MSWQQLLDILHSSADEIAEELRRPPLACPNDGEPLLSGPDGELHCKYDGFRWVGGGSNPQ